MISFARCHRYLIIRVHAERNRSLNWGAQEIVDCFSQWSGFNGKQELHWKLYDFKKKIKGKLSKSGWNWLFKEQWLRKRAWIENLSLQSNEINKSKRSTFFYHAHNNQIECIWRISSRRLKHESVKLVTNLQYTCSRILCKLNWGVHSS